MTPNPDPGAPPKRSTLRIGVNTAVRDVVERWRPVQSQQLRLQVHAPLDSAQAGLKGQGQGFGADRGGHTGGEGGSMRRPNAPMNQQHRAWGSGAESEGRFVFLVGGSGVCGRALSFGERTTMTNRMVH